MSQKETRETYERIGTHFSKTRANPWPEVEAFLADRQGDLGFDIGCGNGRHTELLAERCERAVGLDASTALIAEARGRAGVELVAGDASRLPFRSDTVDLAVYVATLHHLPEGARAASLEELARVLAPGGRALVSVWSTTHSKFDSETGFDTEIDWTLPDGEKVGRYYHIFAPEEFRALVEGSPVTLHGFDVSSGNCYAVVGPEG
jgi:ubiquinone/menaquinone biosynthesis C-methylase UbiE